MSLYDALIWKYPGAQCVVRDGELERWDGPMPEPPADDIAQAAKDYAARPQPRLIDNRDLMRRIEASEHRGLENLAAVDDNVLKLWNTLKSGGAADVHSDEFSAGIAYLRVMAVPTVWPDEKTFDARMAAITA